MYDSVLERVAEVIRLSRWLSPSEANPSHCIAEDLAAAGLLVTDFPDTRQVDPPDCGCTECITGEYRTAMNWADYYAAHPDEEMPDWAVRIDAAN